MIHRIFFILGITILYSVVYVQAGNNHNKDPEHVSSKSKVNATIRGHVIDKTSGEHVPFINIILRGTTMGTATDATGHFTLRNIPSENVILVATAVGYKTVEKSVKLQDRKSVV